MRAPNLPFLTYLAQVRQLPFKNAWLYPMCALTIRHILHIRQPQRRGQSRKEIAIIGTVRVAVLAGQNKSTGEWLKDAGYWRQPTNFISSQSLVEERKFVMNTPRKTMANGRTGFWMLVDCNGNVRVVNGTMYKLLSAKKGCILTHILSRRFRLKILWSLLQQKHPSGLMDNDGYNEFPAYGVNGSPPHLKGVVWGLNTISREWKAPKVHHAMSQSTYLNPPFSRLIGLRDGNASDTLKAFQNRQKGKGRQ